MIIAKYYIIDLTCRINGAAIEVHKILGLGFLEKIYHKCLAHEFSSEELILNQSIESPSITKEWKRKQI